MNTKKQTTIYIQVGTKKFPLIITYMGKKYEEDEVVHIKCEVAKLDQEYLKDDLPLLLQDIEELILMEQKTTKQSTINIRVKTEDKLQIEKNAVKFGFKSVSEYMLDRALKI